MSFIEECTKRVFLGHSKVAFIEGILMPGVALMRGSTVVKDLGLHRVDGMLKVSQLGWGGGGDYYS